MGNLERMSNFGKKSYKKNQMYDIFMNFKDGDNPIRLIGEIVEVRYHYVGMPKDKRIQSIAEPAFLDRNNENSVPSMVACMDWDVENQKENDDKRCPYCAIQREMFRRVRKENITPEQVETYKTLSQQIRVQASHKVNCIDRKDCFVTKKNDDGTEEKVKGLKIASFGTRAMESLAGIFRSTQRDIADVEGGIDLIVNKSNKSGNTSYSVVPVVSGMSMKVTPLTEEERSWIQHDVKMFGGLFVPVEKMVKALRPEFSMVYHEIVKNSFGTGQPMSQPVSQPVSESVSQPVEVPVSAPVTLHSTVNPPVNTPVAKPAPTQPKAPKCMGYYEQGNAECDEKCPENWRNQCIEESQANG